MPSASTKTTPSVKPTLCLLGMPSEIRLLIYSHIESPVLIHVVYVSKESDFPSDEERVCDLCWTHDAFSLLALSYTSSTLRKEVQPLLKRPIHLVNTKNLHFHARSEFLTPMSFGAIMPYDDETEEGEDDAEGETDDGRRADEEGDAGHNCDQSEQDHSSQALDHRRMQESNYLKQIGITIESGPADMEGPISQGASQQQCEVIHLLLAI
ncbi:hypothetical protein FJTKL_07418 [Diaporthe vaccinii]|uniref:F-box domain-containing protein n=1 Tax=Diaporthe vaccinii TaxID=105482 RepID=A0ABR4EUJ0_9PEZI